MLPQGTRSMSGVSRRSGGDRSRKVAAFPEQHKSERPTRSAGVDPAAMTVQIIAVNLWSLPVPRSYGGTKC